MVLNIVPGNNLDKRQHWIPGKILLALYLLRDVSYFLSYDDFFSDLFQKHISKYYQSVYQVSIQTILPFCDLQNHSTAIFNLLWLKAYCF